MNELKLMAIKAKSRLLNKGIREIYSSTNIKENTSTIQVKDFSTPTLDIVSEEGRKKQILDMIKMRVSR